MDPLDLMLGLPLFGALILAVSGHRPLARDINVALNLATLLAALALTAGTEGDGARIAYDGHVFIDALNASLALLTAFVAFTTSLFSRPYMQTELERGRMTQARMRIYFCMYQFFTFAMLLALCANNIGLLWVAMEAATLATVLLISIYRTPASLEAAWKYFILCGVGLAQALFGTILLYMASEQAVAGKSNALLWTNLNTLKDHLNPQIMSLAFVFLLLGYGTKVGLVPVHSWLPDAHAEGPTPISAILSGLLLNVALHAVLRFKVLADGALQGPFAGRLMMGFGLLSVVIAALFLTRQKDVKRLFAYSSIEHMGLITFAFGLGGTAAAFAGLLHMTAHSLTKSAIFFSAGHASQQAGSQRIADIQGLLKLHPALGWGMMLGALSILGMPPFGVFASEFLILTVAIQQAPWVTPLLLMALGVAFAAIFGRAQKMVFGTTQMSPMRNNPALLPVFIHVGLGLMFGLFVPAWLVQIYQQAANILG